jgi:membrane protein YdbS with pleckstrin-like domain
MDTLEPESSRDESDPKPENEPVAVADTQPASIADGAEHSVDPAAVVLGRLLGMLFVVGVGGAGLIALTLAWALAGIPASLYLALLVAWGTPVVGLGFFAWRWPVLRHRHLRYRVDTSGIRIRQGVLWRKIISIPTTRVQHTDVTQGPLERSFGLATLTVHTAGTQGASIALSGLSHEVALRLRDHLLPGKRNGN